MSKHARRFIPLSILTLALIVGAPTHARAQAFVSPSIGYDFAGDASCPQITDCQEMSNAMIIPKIGPVRPYALAGLGLIKTHVELKPSSALSSTNNNLGWDVGGGVAAFFGVHAGVRGDIRYFHAFQDLNALGFTLSDTKLDFGRASVGLVLAF